MAYSPFHSFACLVRESSVYHLIGREFAVLKKDDGCGTCFFLAAKSSLVCLFQGTHLLLALAYEKIFRWEREKRFLYLLGILYFCSLLFLPPLLSQKARFIGKKISLIEFYGLQNLSADELYEVITSRYEKALEEAAFNEDVRLLFATGYFSNVLMRVRLLKDGSVALSYEVTELPQIKELIYIGLEELNSQEFIQKIDIKEGDFFSLQKVKDAVSTIQSIYEEQGFFHAEVWYRISPVDKADNTLKVYILVDEGKLIPISKINILGTRRLDPDLITAILEQKESGALSDSPFQEDKFEGDKFRILSYAKSQGLLNAQLDPEATGYEIRWRNPKKPEDGRVVVISYKIIEGEIKYYGGYSLEHIAERLNKELNPPERKVKSKSQLTPVYSPETLLDIVEYSKNEIGDLFDENRYFRDRGAMQEAYARQGYVFAQIRPEIIDFTLDLRTLKRYESCLKIQRPSRLSQRKCKQEAKRLHLKELQAWLEEYPEEEGRPMRHVHFKASENNLAYVEGIIIRGNEKTKEHVIRREILIKEGQLFNSSLVTLSRQRLINLQYFSEVNLQMRPGSSQDKMNIIFEVKEQPTGNISVGGAYSVTSGFSLNMKLAENNFRGTGTSLSGTLNYGPNQRGLSVQWQDPWFYESCEDDTGPFWKNKQKAFNEAESLDRILLLSQGLQNEHESLGQSIRDHAAKFKRKVSTRELDQIKLHIRKVLAKYVHKEEKCFRSYPSPWSLGIGSFINSTTVSDSISGSGSALAESFEYEETRYGLSFSTSHPLGPRWSHYHSYIPSWSAISNPSALAPDILFLRTRQGVQFQSSLRNGLLYSSIDNTFNPTRGMRQRLEAEIVGSYLGGNDHFNRYILSSTHYLWWFDFSFGGFFHNRSLRRWRVVQEFTFSGAFTEETAPVHEEQDQELNPYLKFTDKLFLGGPGSRRNGRLRGYSPGDPNYPRDWHSGSHHRLLFGTELRIPIEPQFLWFAFFIDAGSLYNTLGDLRGNQKIRHDNYASEGAIECTSLDPDVKRHYNSCIDWNNPERTGLSLSNASLERFLYSWGYGLRVQIPVLPLRIYYAPEAVLCRRRTAQAHSRRR